MKGFVATQGFAAGRAPGIGPTRERGEHLARLRRLGAPLEQGQPCVDRGGRGVKAARQAGVGEGRRNLAHLALEAPRLGGAVGGAPVRRCGQPRPPLPFQRVPHPLALGQRQDRREQGRGALGVGCVAHLQRGGRADAVREHRRAQRFGREAGGHPAGGRARQIERRARRTAGRRSADDAPVDAGRAGAGDRRLDGAGAVRRDGVAVGVDAGEPGGGHLLGDCGRRVRRADRQDHLRLRGQRLQAAGVLQTGRCRTLARLGRPVRRHPQNPMPGFRQHPAHRRAHLARMQQADSRLFHGRASYHPAQRLPAIPDRRMAGRGPTAL